jgi:twitching motility protein PilT
MASGLQRQGVTEFAAMSGQRPCVKVNGSYEPVAPRAVTDDELIEFLMTIGGVPFVDKLGPEAVSWKAEEEGLGLLSVKAARRDGTLHARVVLLRGAAKIPAATGAGPMADAPASTVAKPQPPPAVKPPPPPVAKAPPQQPAKAPPARSALPADSSQLHELLNEARHRGASDLHVVSGRPALFRIAGELEEGSEPIDAAAVEQMLAPIVPERLAASFERDGSCDFALEQPNLGRFRVNVGRQRTGFKASIRLIGRELPTLASLGLPDAIGNATHHHQGLIVLTGPTGHGKTSTLAALVDLLNTETTHHIVTVEDPVEYVHPPKKALISQREVGTHTRSFASALKASLREDPDVIVVGELRDTETVRMALSASETGHLVIATMNTPSAARTIDRLIDLFPPGDQPQVRMALAGGLRLIVSQRLVRSIDGSRVFAAAEVLPGSVALWNLIRENKTFQIPSLQQRGRSMGIVRLDDSLADLVRAGKVILDEARAFAEAPDELVQALGGARANAAPRKAG